jgi:hypothetical protein
MFAPNYIYQKYDDYQKNKCFAGKTEEEFLKEIHSGKVINPDQVKCLDGVYCLAVQWSCLTEEQKFVALFQLFSPILLFLSNYFYYQKLGKKKALIYAFSSCVFFILINTRLLILF